MKSIMVGWLVGALLLCRFLCLAQEGEGVYPSAMSLNFLQNRETASPHTARGSDAPPNSWRGLVPLHSTRVDVERLLGKPKWTHGSTFVYETECERVDVLYSKGACELSAVERWNVPTNVAIRLEVAPRRKLLVKDLKLEATRYRRDRESHPENWVQYRSLEDGIRVNALLDGKDETVTVITYEPRTKDNVLRCASTK